MPALLVVANFGIHFHILQIRTYTCVYFGKSIKYVAKYDYLWRILNFILILSNTFFNISPHFTHFYALFEQQN